MKIVTGIIIKGKQKGRILGFPTANIEAEENLESGIYAGNIIIKEKKYHSAIYSAGDKIVEAYILDFSGDLYGEKATIEIIEKIRDKKNFKSDAEISQQIAKDIIIIKEYLQNNK